MAILKNNSSTFRKWIKYDSFELATQISQATQLSPVVASILANRVQNIQEVDSFLNVKIKNQMQSPFLLQDMNKACDLLLNACRNQEKILILSDYDVDGITSLTILYKYLKHHKASVDFYIPNRYQEGYGLSSVALKNILTLNFDVLVLLDNGSASVDEVATLLQHNKKVVIIDHHAIGVNLPKAHAFINPKRLDDTSNNNDLCTVGLVFLLLVALNRVFSDNNFLQQNNLSSINILEFLDLVALGTVADMVPLVGLNRAYVVQGVKILKNRKNLPLVALVDALKINKPLEVSDLAFSIIPSLNASSRMGHSELGFQLLTSISKETSDTLAKQIISLNNQRKLEENKIIEAAIQQISESSVKNENLIFLGSKLWIAGVVGIIAGRIKDIYNVPTCIFHIDEEKQIATASGRSIVGVDLGNIIIAANQKGLLIKGGGHSQAVGFSFELSKQEELMQFINQKISRILDNQELQATVMVDDILSINEINMQFTKNIQELQPFGMFFPEPNFVLNKVLLQNVKQIGNMKNHISCDVVGNYNFKLKAFCYKCLPGVLGESILKNDSLPVDLVVTVQPNFFKGRYYNNLIIKDIASCS